MLKFLFVISFIFIGLFSGCSSKQNITVVIQNNLEQDIYVPNLGLAMIDYGDDEKIYYLSPADDFNPKSLGLSAVAFFVGFINIIKSNEIYHTRIREFDINNKRYEDTVDEKSTTTEILKEPEYEQVFFKLYYTMEPLEMRSYEEYISIMKEKGFSVFGDYEDNEIIFVIDTEVSINERAK